MNNSRDKIKESVLRQLNSGKKFNLAEAQEEAYQIHQEEKRIQSTRGKEHDIPFNKMNETESHDENREASPVPVLFSENEHTRNEQFKKGFITN